MRMSNRFIFLILLMATAPALAELVLPELPHAYVDTTFNLPTCGQTIHVRAGDDLQAAFDAAQPCDVLLLEAGAVFTGEFTLPNKAGNGWIYIMSSRHAELPPPGTRIDPAVHTHLMPKIVSRQRQSATTVLTPSLGAHHYRFVGLEITTEHRTIDFQQTTLIRMGNDAASPDDLPHHLIFDRVYIHGTVEGSIRTGIQFNARHGAVIDSVISEIHERGSDGGYTLTVNLGGAGPFEIRNNFLEASGINILIGGTNPRFEGLLPSDFRMVGNHFYKNPIWNKNDPVNYADTPWGIKNLLEFKHGQRFLIDRNVFENSWTSYQDGTAILIKMGGNASWETTEDITFTNNIIKNANTGIRLGPIDAGTDGHVRRVKIHNNLMVHMHRRLFELGTNARPTTDLIITHNTALHTTSGDSFMTFTSPPGRLTIDRALIRDNILGHGNYGVKGNSTGAGNPSFAAFFDHYVFANNAIYGGGSAGNYPAGNLFVGAFQNIGFVSASNHDYRLGPSSPYKDHASDGTDIGVDMGVLSAVPQNPPTVPPDDDPPTTEPPGPNAPGSALPLFKNFFYPSRENALEIPCRSNVKIMDRSGRLVRELTCGGDSTVWDGKNQEGTTVSAGVYIVLRTDEQNRRIVVIK